VKQEQNWQQIKKTQLTTVPFQFFQPKHAKNSGYQKSKPELSGICTNKLISSAPGTSPPSPLSVLQWKPDFSAHSPISATAATANVRE